MRLVRSTIPLIVIFVSTIQADDVPPVTDKAAEGPVVSFSESVVYHGPGESIAAACHAPIDVVGCTAFPVERIECKCELHGDKWLFDAHATIAAEVHLSNRRPYNVVLSHERLHLADLKAGLRAHLESVMARRFNTAPECQFFAMVVSSPSYVRDVMNRLRKASNEKYHCQPPRTDAASRH